MRLLIITEAPYFGGTDTYTLNLYHYYKSSGIECKIVINSESGGIERYAREVDNHDLLLIHNATANFKTRILYWLPSLLINLIKIPFNFMKLIKLMKKNGIDHVIIVSGGWPGGYLTLSAIIQSFFLKIPVIATIHNYPVRSRKTAVLSRLVVQLSKLATPPSLVTVSEDCKTALNAYFDPLKIEVIPNAVPDFVEKNDGNNFLKTNLVFVGNIENRKGLHVLLQAMHILGSEKNIYKLFVYGEFTQPKYAKQIEAEAKGLNIEWCGFENDKNKIFATKGLLILPSVSFESFGLVIIEAMCAGVPVLVSDSLGMREVIEKSQLDSDYATFKTGDAEDLANKIIQITDSYDSLQLRKKARQSFEENYEIGKMYSSLSQLFRRYS